MLSFHSRTGYPLPVSPAASPLTLPRPTLSKQCFRFTLHLSSRVVPVTCFVRVAYQVHPYRDSCTTLVHELLLQNFAIENRYLNSYKCTIQLFGRVVLRSLQLVSFETVTLNDYSGLTQTPRNLI